MVGLFRSSLRYWGSMDICAKVAAWALKNNTSNLPPCLNAKCHLVSVVGGIRVYDAGTFNTEPKHRFIVQHSDGRLACIGSIAGSTIHILHDDGTIAEKASAPPVHCVIPPGRSVLYAADNCVGTGKYISLHKGQQVVPLEPIHFIDEEAWVRVAVLWPIMPGSTMGYVRNDNLVAVSKADATVDLKSAGCTLSFAPSPCYTKANDSSWSVGEEATFKHRLTGICELPDFGLTLSCSDVGDVTVVASTHQTRLPVNSVVIGIRKGSSGNLEKFHSEETDNLDWWKILKCDTPTKRQKWTFVYYPSYSKLPDAFTCSPEVAAMLIQYCTDQKEVQGVNKRQMGRSIQELSRIVTGSGGKSAETVCKSMYAAARKHVAEGIDVKELPCASKGTRYWYGQVIDSINKLTST